MEDRITADLNTDVLIIGAGPFGLSLAAHLHDLGIDHRIVGRPMGFWQEQMPRGMLLRSGIDWHLDVQQQVTIEAFLAAIGKSRAEIEPLSRDFYLAYVRWFQEQKGLEPLDLTVQALDVGGGPSGGYLAQSESMRIAARNVVVAIGFRDFAYIPPETLMLLPPGRFAHTADLVDFRPLAGKRVTIVGGRQSAFEWAALLTEAGAVRVDLVYRHETPRFEASDWAWVDELMERTEVEPDWYRRLSDPARAELGARFWAEGRLKLEPWLADRLDRSIVRLWPGRKLIAAQELRDGPLELILDDGSAVQSDQVIFATGYKVELTRVPFLTRRLLSGIETRNGSPVLTEYLESSLAGLYFTSMAATQDFGPFFAFTVSARCSARLIGDSLKRRLG